MIMMMKTTDEMSMLETTSSLRIIQSPSSSTSSSSIGNNSDTHDQNDDDDIQSPYDYNNDNNNNNNGSGSSSSSSSFDDAIQALEQALPIRRGISAFYNGKSKSFTSLNNEGPTTTSIQDIAKPETPYTRKRRNLGAFKLPYMNTGRISKKSKTTTLHFTLEREKVNHHHFANHATLSKINRPLPSRSFSMVNLL